MSPRDVDLGMSESILAPVGGSKASLGAAVAAHRVRARDG